MADGYLIVQIIATLGLVFVTFWYAWTTKNMFITQRKMLNYEIRPNMHAFLQFMGPMHLKFKFQNIGKGVAKDIIATVHFGDKREIWWYWPALGSGDREIIHLPKKYHTWDTFLNSGDVKIKFNYSNMLNKKHTTKITINSTSLKRTLKESKTAYEEPYMEQIIKELEEIKKKMK